MNPIKRRLLEGIEIRARRRLSELSTEYIGAPDNEKEAIQAGIRFERWLADGCRDLLE